MCFMLLNPFNKCIGVATRKNTFFNQKMAKRNLISLPQISVFRVRVVTSCPPYPILRMLHSKKDVLHAMVPIEQLLQGRNHQNTPKSDVVHSIEPISQVYWGPHPTKHYFSPKNGEENPIFLPQISVFQVRVVTSWPPYPILRMLHCQNNVLHAIEPI